MLQTKSSKTESQNKIFYLQIKFNHEFRSIAQWAYEKDEMSELNFKLCRLHNCQEKKRAKCRPRKPEVKLHLRSNRVA